MTRNNQLYVDEGRRVCYCRSCNRHFNDYLGALTHCRDSQVHRGEWCRRCEWLFVSSTARDSHIKNSSCHNLCHCCNVDFRTSDELEEHNLSTHNRRDRCHQHPLNRNNLPQV